MSATSNRLRAGMVGLGMIFDETYRPLFEQLHAEGLYRRDFGLVDVELAAVASRTGSRAERYRKDAAGRVAPFASFAGADAMPQLLDHGVDAVCVATPDDRHFEPARLALEAGKHVLIEKPSVLRLQELDELDRLARQQQRAGQGRLSQARRPRSQEAAHPRRRRRPAARQQRLLHAAGAEVRSAAASSPSGSPAAIRAPTSPSITSS